MCCPVPNTLLLQGIGKQALLDAKVEYPSRTSWDGSRRSSNLVLSNNDTTVTPRDTMRSMSANFITLGFWAPS